MNIQRAIALLGMLQLNLASEMDAEDLMAIQLSIEALKRFQYLRTEFDPDEYALLPGETKD